MYLWILFFALIAIATLLVILGIKLCWDIAGAVVPVFLYVVALVLLLVCVIQTVSVPKEIYQFKTQKQYIETHVVKDSIENAALTTKKIELNDWLYNVQYKNANWGGWSFYPDEVQDLTPIQ